MLQSLPLLLLLFFIAHVRAVFDSAQSFWPAAWPLAVKTPYLNTYSNTLKGANSISIWPRHWNDQQINGWALFIRIDNVTFSLLGEAPGPNASTVLMSQFTPTRSMFLIEAGPTLVNVTFLSPLPPIEGASDTRTSDVDQVFASLPFSYMTVSFQARDNVARSVQIYSDVSGEWVSGKRDNLIVWNTTDTGNIVYHTCVRQAPDQFVEVREQAEDGVLYYATAQSPTLTFQTGADTDVRGQFMTNGRLTGAQDTGFRAISNRFPVYAHSYDLGSVSSSSDLVWAIGLVRDPVVQYYVATTVGSSTSGTSGNSVTLAQQMRSGLWKTRWASAQDALTAFLGSYPAALSVSQKIDQKISDDASSVSQEYVNLVSFGSREAWAGVDITVPIGNVGSTGTGSGIRTFMKDLGFSRRINAVSTLYSSLPMFLYFNASFVGTLLEPLLESQYFAFDFVQRTSNSSGSTVPGSSFNPSPTWAVPDLGVQYPLATKANDLASALATPGSSAGGDSTSIGTGAVDDTGSMLIMTLAHAQCSGDGSLIGKYYWLLKSWATFLAQSSLDLPSGQTADQLTKSNLTNLALKGITGVKSFALIARAAGQTADFDVFDKNATDMIAEWTKLTTTQGHLASTLEGEGFGLIYNLYADQLLNLDLVDSIVYTAQTAFYDSLLLSASKFGIAFDSSVSQVRSDYTLFTSGTASTSQTRNNLVSLVHQRANFNESRGVFPALYDATTGSTTNGLASPAQGGLFALLALGLSAKTINVPSLASPPAGSSSSSSTSSSVNAGVIAGAAVGGVLGLGTLVALGVFLWRRRQRRRNEEGVPFRPENMSLAGANGFGATWTRPPPSFVPATNNGGFDPAVDGDGRGTAYNSTYSSYVYPRPAPAPPGAAPPLPRKGRPPQSTENQDRWETQTRASSSVLPSDVIYPSSPSASNSNTNTTRSGGRGRSRQSRETEAELLRGEVQNLRMEMAQMRENYMPPPGYD